MANKLIEQMEATKALNNSRERKAVEDRVERAARPRMGIAQKAQFNIARRNVVG